MNPLTRFILFVFFCFTVSLANAESPDTTIPTAPDIAASAYFLQDFHTGKILAEKNADTQLPPASLTKIMTVYVAFQEIRKGHLKLTDVVTVSENAQNIPSDSSKMFLKAKDQVKVEELIKGIIIPSGNDASIALAEHIAGDVSTFADMMNKEAVRLGMKNTHFSDSDGLSQDNHYTSPRDLAILSTALVKEFPEYYPWFSQKALSYNKITQQNYNLLLKRDESVDGIKTGHTKEAGYCLVASSLREGMRLISVIMGTKSEKARADESQKLLNYGFRFYESHKLFDGNKPLKEPRLWKGTENSVQLGLAEDLYATIPRRRYEDLKATIVVDKKITAPVKQGNKYGTVTVTLKGETLLQKDLIALKNVPTGNILQRTYDSILMLIGHSDNE